VGKLTTDVELCRASVGWRGRGRRWRETRQHEGATMSQRQPRKWPPFAAATNRLLMVKWLLCGCFIRGEGNWRIWDSENNATRSHFGPQIHHWNTNLIRLHCNRRVRLSYLPHLLTSLYHLPLSLFFFFFSFFFFFFFFFFFK
jgi:hypothetical protein